MNNYQFTKTLSEFTSQATVCRGDLYLPIGVANPPIVVMAHGFGAERKFCLPKYAEHFASNGLAVYLFDYRCLGESDGKPRNYIDPNRHLEDWQAALKHVRSLTNINTKKIALWGSSYAGGHVIVTASKNPDVSAIVSQVPHVDANATAKTLGLGYLIKATLHGLLDLLCMLTNREPHYVKIYSGPEEFAALNTEESRVGYESIIPKDSTWINRCPARIFLVAPFYSPTKFAEKVQCPALVMLAEKDSLIPAQAVEQTALKMPKGKLIKYPFGHFDIYNGKYFEDAIKEQTSFLLSHLTS
jgi:dienelactone hydrolase